MHIEPVAACISSASHTHWGSHVNHGRTQRVSHIFRWRVIFWKNDLNESTSIKSWTHSHEMPQKPPTFLGTVSVPSTSNKHSVLPNSRSPNDIVNYAPWLYLFQASKQPTRIMIRPHMWFGTCLTRLRRIGSQDLEQLVDLSAACDVMREIVQSNVDVHGVIGASDSVADHTGMHKYLVINTALHEMMWVRLMCINISRTYMILHTYYIPVLCCRRRNGSFWIGRAPRGAGSTSCPTQ